MIRYAIFVCFVTIFILSCGGKMENISVSSFNQTEFIVYTDEVTNILSAVCGKSVCRFTVFDMLGAPIVSKTYGKGRLVSNKFLPPNKDYDELFIFIMDKGIHLKSFEWNIGSVKAYVRRYE